MGTLVNSEDPDEMPHYQGLRCMFAKIKAIFRERNSILVGNCNL